MARKKRYSKMGAFNKEGGMDAVQVLAGGGAGLYAGSYVDSMIPSTTLDPMYKKLLIILTGGVVAAMAPSQYKALALAFAAGWSAPAIKSLADHFISGKAIAGPVPAPASYARRVMVAGPYNRQQSAQSYADGQGLLNTQITTAAPII